LTHFGNIAPSGFGEVQRFAPNIGEVGLDCVSWRPPSYLLWRMGGHRSSMHPRPNGQTGARWPEVSRQEARRAELKLGVKRLWCDKPWISACRATA